MKLNLVLRGHIKRFGVRAADQTWANVWDNDDAVTTKWVQPGYFIPNWIYQSSDFTTVDSISPLPEVSDDVYRTRRGLGTDDVFEIPAVLGQVLNASQAAAPEKRGRFLRACYWYERSGAAWNMSVSLGHIAAVNAIETIMPPGSEDRCPECGMNRAAGPTRRFRDFVERYASLVAEEDRQRVYGLRSALVHGGQVFDIDRPGAFGALIPRDQNQRDTYSAARIIARDAITNWLLDPAA